MDKEYQTKIRAFYETHRRMPSYSEMMRFLGFASRASVFKLVERLERSGFLVKEKNGKIAPGNIWGTLTVLGVVEAGFPSPAEEYREDTMSLDEYLIPRRDASFMLKVKGDSMRDAGIVEGDMVIVERGAPAHTGDIVIARIDGEYTMKYYRMKGRQPYLEPANIKYPDMFPKDSLEIEAVVRSVVRKYR